MTYLEKLLGNNIKKYRNAIGLSAEKLAEKVGISRQSLGKIESGEGFVTASTFEKLCEVLEITPSMLVSLDNLPDKIEDENECKLLLNQIIRELSPKQAQAFYKLALAFLEIFA